MTINSVIFSLDGASGYVDGKPFTVTSKHPNYLTVMEALRLKQYDQVHGLLDIQKMVEKQVEKYQTINGIKLDLAAGTVTYKGFVIGGNLVQQILTMARRKFDVTPMCNVINNAMSNPNVDVPGRVYDWMVAANMPISDDGCLIAYKRVRTDMTSFYDGKTFHRVGQVTEIPREDCCEDSSQTCAAGLHFCSQQYLPSYCGGQGKILMLKINPRDIVAIPPDYNNSKGRCCKYEVIAVLNSQMQAVVEEENIMHDVPVVNNQQEVDDLGVDMDARVGYTAGYQHGKARLEPMARTVDQKVVGLSPNYVKGYVEGYKDGRGHKSRKYK